LIISLIISTLIIKNLNKNFLINTILLSSAFYLFFVTSKDFLVKGFTNLSQNIAHFGFSLFILSILLNNIFSTEIITNLKIGETYKSEKIKINFVSIKSETVKNYDVIIGKFNIENVKNEIDILKPELRIYDQPNIITSEAAIKTNLFTDKFITMNLVQNQDYFNIRYQIKPFMIWIWLSVFLISLGGLMSLLNKKNEN
jgi:cytochrome c-type biogenesis protein CcmF